MTKVHCQYKRNPQITNKKFTSLEKMGKSDINRHLTEKEMKLKNP